MAEPNLPAPTAARTHFEVRFVEIEALYDEEEVVLESVPYEDIIDQPRRWVGRRAADIRVVALSADPNDAPAAGTDER